MRKIVFYRLYLIPPPPSASFPGGIAVKNPSAGAGDTRDTDLIPGFGRSLGVGNGNAPQYSYLENSMDIGGLWVIVQGSQRVGHD